MGNHYCRHYLYEAQQERDYHLDSVNKQLFEHWKKKENGNIVWKLHFKVHLIAIISPI